METEYLFCKGTDLVGESGRGRIRVRERIKIGEDVWRSFDGLTKVELFSSCLYVFSVRSLRRGFFQDQCRDKVH